MKRFKVVLVICAIICFSLTGSVYADTVGLSLVMDGSGSISSADWLLQLQGYANAIADPSVVRQDGTVSISVVQFSDTSAVQIPMTTISSQADANALAAQILLISQIGQNTCISCGILSGVSTFTSTFDKQVIDVSTDGFWNEGIDPLTAAQDAVNNDGITAVNALGIGPSAVLGFSYGTGSFEMSIPDFDAFEASIRDKIGRETGNIPEPSAFLLLGTGLAGLGFMRRRFRK